MFFLVTSKSNYTKLSRVFNWYSENQYVECHQTQTRNSLWYFCFLHGHTFCFSILSMKNVMFLIGKNVYGIILTPWYVNIGIWMQKTHVYKAKMFTSMYRYSSFHNLYKILGASFLSTNELSEIYRKRNGISVK